VGAVAVVVTRKTSKNDCLSAVFCYGHWLDGDMSLSETIPVIDVFAGPGGLGEGFSSLRAAYGYPAFDVRLSIEKDRYAHKTLELRSFFRHFRGQRVPEDYYHYVRGPEYQGWIDRDTLFARYEEAAEAARNHAWHFALGLDSRRTIRERIDEALRSAGSTGPWVLIGGPPCQAYSTAGRSRMKRKQGSGFDEDERHVLYREYLQIIHDHRPHVFVMENVKGLLSSKLHDKPVFDLICEDLRNAAGNNSYLLFSFVAPATVGSVSAPHSCGLNPGDYVIESELYGIPQCRHRVILLGIRANGFRLNKSFSPGILRRSREMPTVNDVLTGLPPLRSGLSRIPDSKSNWKEIVQSIAGAEWLHELRGSGLAWLARKIRQTVRTHQRA